MYSIDSIRINFKLAGPDELKRILSIFSRDLAVQYHASARAGTFQHLFTWRYGEQSFTVGLSLVNPVAGSGALLRGFMDFNPNKVLGAVTYENGFVRAFSSPFDENAVKTPENAFKRYFCSVYALLRGASRIFEIARYDLAIDLNICRSRVQLLKDRRKYSQYRKSVEDLTEYLGSHSSAGFCKVYNKRIESELDYDCTRIEVTCSSLEYKDFLAIFPAVYVHDDNLATEQLSLLVDLLSLLPVDEFDLYYKRLSKYQRSKLDIPLLRSPFVLPESVFDRLAGVVRSFIDGSFVDG